MSGKQHKRERKRQKELERKALRRKQRQATMFTVIVIALVIAIGAVLVWVTFAEDRRAAQELEDLLAQTPTPGPTEDLSDRPVACDASVPLDAGAEKPTFTEPPEMMLEEGTDYRAIFDTSCGQVVVDLYEDRAPLAVNNFVFLAEQGFYNGLEIFRHAPGIFALQTGSGINDAAFQIGYTFEDELAAAEEEGYTAGSLAMANSGPDTNGSQIFFTYGDSPLTPDFTKFGQVLEGLDVLERIGEIPLGGPTGETPTEVIYINTVLVAAGTDIPTEGATSAPTAGATPTAPPETPPATEPTATPTGG